MLNPLVKTQDEYRSTVKEIVEEIIQYLEKNCFNYVPVRLFEVNYGFHDEYRTVKDLKKSYLLEDERPALLYTFRESCVLDENGLSSTFVVNVTYEVCE